MDKTHRFCMVCTTVYKIDQTKVHNCYFTNESLCEYQMYMIAERGTAIFHCCLCSTVTKTNQDVKCKAADFSIITQEQIPRPYFCSKLDCPLHLGYQTIFCSLHPDFKSALIVEYDTHHYDTNNTENTEICIYCGTTPDQGAAYCHEHMKVESLAEYLNKFPLVSHVRVKRDANSILQMGTITRNVSEFFILLF